MLFILKKLVTLQLVLLVVEGPEWLVAEKLQAVGGHRDFGGSALFLFIF